MKIFRVVILFGLIAILGGCAALMDGKFVGRHGKESPFKAPDYHDKIPSDPTSPFSF